MQTTMERSAIKLVDLASQVPADEVDDLLDNACGSNAPLRLYVENLLTAMNDSREFLQATTVDGFDPEATEFASRMLPLYQLENGDFLANRYLIWDSIGTGGMAEVYRALDSRLGRDVAIKILNPASIANERLRMRFEQELQSVASLSHPNVTAIYDINQHERQTFAVMELVDGVSLRDLIAERPCIDTCVQLIAGVAAGLAAAHDRGIMHRDIKPENIMIAACGSPKVLDFGIARRIDEMNQNLTGSDLTPGTVPYMSPEQAEGEPLSCKTDIFSLGSVFYELLTGTNPFRGKTAAVTLRQVTHAAPQSLREVGANTPEGIANLVMAMLSADPVLRPPANDIVQTLQRAEHTAATRFGLTGRSSGRTEIQEFSVAHRRADPVQ